VQWFVESDIQQVKVVQWFVEGMLKVVLEERDDEAIQHN